MPLYDFQCPSCGCTKEYALPLNGLTASYQCPACGKWMDRLPSAPATHFKGAGWTPKFYDRRQPRRGD